MKKRKESLSHVDVLIKEKPVLYSIRNKVPETLFVCLNNKTNIIRNPRLWGRDRSMILL